MSRFAIRLLETVCYVAGFMGGLYFGRFIYLQFSLPEFVASDWIAGLVFVVALFGIGLGLTVFYWTKALPYFTKNALQIRRMIMTSATIPWKSLPPFLLLSLLPPFYASLLIAYLAVLGFVIIVRLMELPLVLIR